MGQHYIHPSSQNAVCPNCKQSFIAKHYSKGKYQQYCSNSCSVKAQHERKEIGFELSNPQYIDGRSTKEYICKCSNKISDYRGKKCKKCYIEELRKRVWKGGITPINDRIRHTPRYRKWRIAVFERDDYTCIFCHQRGGRLQADHIKPFSLFPELRFELLNGRTLCMECHKKTDTYLNRYMKRTSINK